MIACTHTERERASERASDAGSSTHPRRWTSQYISFPYLNSLSFDDVIYSSIFFLKKITLGHGEIIEAQGKTHRNCPAMKARSGVGGITLHMPYTVRFFREGSIEVDCHWLDGDPTTHSIAISHPVVSGGARSLFLVPRKWAIPCEESKDPRPWPVFFFWSSFLLFLIKSIPHSFYYALRHICLL